MNKSPIISFLNYKGGVGKTNVSVNFAYYSAMIKKQRTLLIDWDPQGDSTEYIGIGRNTVSSTMFDFVVNEEEPIIGENIIQSPYENLFVVGANSSLKNIETYIAKDEDLYSVYRDIISNFSEQFDVVVIDCPPANSPLNVASIFASTNIFIVTTPSSDSIDKIRLVDQRINEISSIIDQNADDDETVRKPEHSGVIVTLADKNTIGLDVATEYLKETWSDKLVKSFAPRTVAASYSVGERVPLLHSKPKTVIAKAYKSIFEEVFARV